MWLRFDNMLIWAALMAEAHARKGINAGDLELWHKYFIKYATLMDLLLKNRSLKMDDESQRISKEVDDMEKDIMRVKKKATRSLLGFTYPNNENAVIFAFGYLYKWIESPLARVLLKEERFDRVEFRTEYPDAELVRGDKSIRIEFETRSGNFKQHSHDVKECDLIVCWIHDWTECPVNVLELCDPNLYEREIVGD